MPVEDVFGIKGRGTVATGRIERGIVKIGDEVEIVGVKATRKVVITGVEMFQKTLDQGQAGDNVGCLMRGIERDEIERGQVLAKPGSIKPHTKFTAQVYVLTKEEGGRHTPFYNGYRPQFYLRTTDVTGAIGLPDGAEMVMPGDNVEMSVELITPDRARGRPALRHPRGWPDRRRRRHRQHRRVTTMAKQRIRIRLKAYDHRLLDTVGGADRGDRRSAPAPTSSARSRCPRASRSSPSCGRRSSTRTAGSSSRSAPTSGSSTSWTRARRRWTR